MVGSMTSGGEGIGKQDVAIAVLFSLLGLLVMYANVRDEEVNASVLAAPLFLPLTVPLLWRRAAPVPALAAVLAGWLVHDLLFGTEVIRCGVVLPITFLLVFAAGARLEQRDALTGLLLGLGLILAESIAFFGAFGVVFAVVTTAIWGIGRVFRSRGRMADELEARTGELSVARDARPARGRHRSRATLRGARRIAPAPPR